MKWVAKLSQFARDSVVRLPPKPEIEREPTIAEDYPLKWAQVQRRRWAFNFLKKVFVFGYFALGAFLLFDVIAPVSEQLRLFVIVIFGAAGLVIFVSQPCLKWFGCPRCQKIFCNFLSDNYPSSFFDAAKRCQHCDLKLSDAPKSTRVR